MSAKAEAHKSVIKAISAVKKGSKGSTVRLQKAIKRYAQAACTVKVTKNTGRKQVTAKVGKRKTKKRSSKK